MKLVLKTFSSDETIELGKKIACFLNRHDVITLNGDLGAGKTTFVKGIAKFFGLNKIKSPTFNIIKCYFKSKIPIYHIDLYRLEKVDQNIGLEEYIEGDGIAIIEWSVFLNKKIKIPHLDVTIKNIGVNKREIIFKTFDKYYEEKIKKIF